MTIGFRWLDMMGQWIMMIIVQHPGLSGNEEWILGGCGSRKGYCTSPESSLSD
jgi:hypothetical protein